MPECFYCIQEGKGSTTAAMEMKPTSDSKVSVENVVQGLRGTMHDAMFIEHSVFFAVVARDLEYHHHRGCKGHTELL